MYEKRSGTPKNFLGHVCGAARTFKPTFKKAVGRRTAFSYLNLNPKPVDGDSKIAGLFQSECERLFGRENGAAWRRRYLRAKGDNMISCIKKP
jgi:hypothetical protein